MKILKNIFEKVSKKVFILISALILVLLIFSVFILPRIIAWYNPSYVKNTSITVPFDSNNVKFSIEPVEEYYLLGETIFLRVIVENNSSKIIKARFPFEDKGLRVYVRDENGQQINSTFILACPSMYADTTSIMPGEKFSNILNLDNFHINKSGKIKVEMRYARMTTFAEIEVQEPKGIDISMYNLLYDPIHFQIKNFDENKVEDMIEGLENYSDSKYAPELYTRVLRIFFMERKKEKYAALIEKYMDRYSDNPCTKTLILSYHSFLKSYNNFTDEQVKEKLFELISKYPQSISLKNYVDKYVNSNFNSNDIQRLYSYKGIE